MVQIALYLALENPPARFLCRHRPSTQLRITDFGARTQRTFRSLLNLQSWHRSPQSQRIDPLLHRLEGLLHLYAVALFPIPDLFLQLLRCRRQKPEAYVGRLEMIGIRVGNIVEQAAAGAASWRDNRLDPLSHAAGIYTGNQPGGDRFHVTFHTA